MPTYRRWYRGDDLPASLNRVTVQIARRNPQGRTSILERTSPLMVRPDYRAHYIERLRRLVEHGPVEPYNRSIEIVSPGRRPVKPLVSIDPRNEQLIVRLNNPHVNVKKFGFSELSGPAWGQAPLIRAKESDPAVLNNFWEFLPEEPKSADPIKVSDITAQMMPGLGPREIGPGGLVPFFRRLRVFGKLDDEDEAELYRFNVQGVANPTGTGLVGVDYFGGNPVYKGRGFLPKVLPTLMEQVNQLHPDLREPLFYSPTGFSDAGEKAFQRPGKVADYPLEERFNADLEQDLGWTPEQGIWWRMLQKRIP